MVYGKRFASMLCVIGAVSMAATPAAMAGGKQGGKQGKQGGKQGDCKPGWGGSRWGGPGNGSGDKNHCHDGPPGQLKR